MSGPFSPALADVRTGTFDTINRYWTDPAYRARMDAETAHQRALNSAKYDAAQIAAGNRWPSDWTEAEKAEASAKALGEAR